jgi:hypothetical protein
VLAGLLLAGRRSLTTRTATAAAAAADGMHATHTLASCVCACAAAVLLQQSKSLYMLVPDGTCGQLGLQPAANTSLITALQALVTASNTPAAAALLNSRISSLNSTAAAGDSSAAAAQVRLGQSCHGCGSVRPVRQRVQQLHPPTSLCVLLARCLQVASVSVNCTDVVFERLPGPKQLQRALFCGNRLAACDRRKATNRCGLAALGLAGGT